MNTLGLNVITLAISVTFTTGAMADDISRHDYQAGKEIIATEYALVKARCAPLSDNAKDTCMAEAKGTAKLALENLNIRFKYTRENRYASSVALAGADYAMAAERCDEEAGNARAVCIREAASAQAAAKADAKSQLQHADAALQPISDPTWRTARQTRQSQMPTRALRRTGLRFDTNWPERTATAGPETRRMALERSQGLRQQVGILHPARPLTQAASIDQNHRQAR